MEIENNNQVIEQNEQSQNVLNNFGMPAITLRGKTIFPNICTTIDVGRIKSLNAVNASINLDKKVFIVSQKDSSVLNPTTSDLYEVGTVCRLGNLTKISGENYRLTVDGLYRAKIVGEDTSRDYFCFNVQKIENKDCDDLEVQALSKVAKSEVQKLLEVLPKLAKEGLSQTLKIEDEEVFLNVASYNLPIKEVEKQKLLEGESIIERYNAFIDTLSKQEQIIEIERKIAERVKSSIDKNQKEFYLREQIKAIHEELGDDVNEIEKLKEKLLKKGLNKEAEEKVLQELQRMSKMAPASPDYNVIRSYIDWILDVPFIEESVDTESIKEVKEILESDHFGLEKVKKRIIEYLAVLKLTKSLKGPILCLVGPPGVGKTSVAKSIARAINRKLVRMSLGGVKDEAEIRGHRKTYIGAMPGRIIYGMKEAKTINPVFLLDEIDKLSQDLRGDPASALLEVLDPEQNTTFRDRYLEIEYDLSKVMFITTANSVDTIPAPLLDRMEVIDIAGYTQEEKVEIAKRYLIPKAIKENGLTDKNVSFNDESIKSIIKGYTGEAGVRKLEQLINTVARKVATKLAEDNSLELQYINEFNIKDYLGAVKYLTANSIEKNQVGSATGLAWTSIGGVALTIEVALMKGKGNLLLTGKLGDVMQESAKTAISFIRANAKNYDIDSSVFENTDIHIHVPEGATPKDGPSAGITMATAILSAFTNRKVRRNVAMTGEITLRGNVLAIGGLKEKALAGYRLGIRKFIIPKQNLKDLEEIPQEILNEIKFVGVDNVDAVFKHAII